MFNQLILHIAHIISIQDSAVVTFIPVFSKTKSVTFMYILSSLNNESCNFKNNFARFAVPPDKIKGAEQLIWKIYINIT